MKRFIVLLSIAFFTQIDTKAQDFEVDISWLNQFSVPNDAPINGITQSVGISGAYLFDLDFLLIGPGIGIDFAHWDLKAIPNSIKKDATAIQPFARLKYIIPIGYSGTSKQSVRVKPFVLADVGYSFMVASNENSENKESVYKRSGFFATPSIGLELSIRNFTSIYFAVGYNIQAINSNEYYRSPYQIQSLALKLGFSF